LENRAVKHDLGALELRADDEADSKRQNRRRTAAPQRGQCASNCSSAGSRLIGMGTGARGTWFYLVVGAVIGLALGILVSVATDVPFAPEVGLALGALVGWLLSRRLST
jgi:hypothetical protein